MCISYSVKSRLIYLDNCCLATLTTCFPKLADVKDLRTRLSSPKVGETFIDFSRPSLP